MRYAKFRFISLFLAGASGISPAQTLGDNLDLSSTHVASPTSTKEADAYLYDLDSDGVHDWTNLPLDSQGWTDLTSISGSRVVYVSSSEGSDRNRGSSPEQPVASIGKGYSLLRNGKPDQLLLKRGDNWTEDLLWRKSGLSKTEPIILSSYGGLDLPRPSMGRFSTRYGKTHPADTFSHMVIAGIQFSQINRVIGGENWLVEDCLLAEGVGNGINVQGRGSVPLKNVILRRNVIHDRHASLELKGHVQGIYVADAVGFLMEENVIDHNGWSETVQGGHATQFNHNVYIQYRTLPPIVFRNNISARASSHGVHQRSGGTNMHNLYLQNPLVQIGYTQDRVGGYGPFQGHFVQNVILDSRNIGRSPRGVGLRIATSFEKLSVEDNIVAHLKSGTGGRQGISVGAYGDQIRQLHGTIVNNNIVYDWAVDGNGTGLAFPFRGGGFSIDNLIIANNEIQMPQGGIPVALSPDARIESNNISFIDNHYYSIGNENVGSRQKNATTSELVAITYPDPQRDISHYVSELGCKICTYDTALNQFLDESKKQRRGYYRPEYSATAVINYIREGFGKKPISVPED